MIFLQRIWTDIKKGENIDLYVTVFVAVGISLVNLLGFFSQQLTSLTLAVLTLLVLSLVVNRHRLEEILFKLDNGKEKFFQTDLSVNQQRELDETVAKGKNLLILGTSLANTLELHYPTFEHKLRKGDTIRIVVGNPLSAACDMAVQRRFLLTDINVWRTQIISSLNILVELKNKTSGDLQIRVIDFHLAHGGILADAQSANGLFFLWYYSFKTKKGNRPKYILRPDQGYWYWHFVEEAEAIWSNSQPWKDIQSVLE